MGNTLSYPEVDLSEKVVIVTGGNQGIGYETAKGLVRLGAHTFIACRSQEKAEEVNPFSAVAKQAIDLFLTFNQAIELMKKELSSAPGKGAKQKLDEKEETGDEQAEPSAEGGDGDTKEAAAEADKDKERSFRVEFLPLDLSSFQSVLECVRIFKEKALPLHILINNAGIAFTPYS